MAETDPEALVAPTKVSTPLKTNEPPISPPSRSAQASKAEAYAQQQPSPSAAYPVFTFPSTLPTPPFIDVHGVPNFRCVGGYLSATGTAVVRPNLLYRCAHLTQITPAGLELLTTKLGVKAIYDLRSEPEVARTTAGALASAAASSPDQQNGHTAPTIPSTSPLFQSLRHFTPVYATEDSSPEALARKLAWYTSPTAATALPYDYSEGYVNAYRSIMLHGAAAYTRIFRHILGRPDDALVFHCTAGKDRTGVFAALVLRLAGVDDETICWEYAVTEAGLGAWRRLFIDRMSGASRSTAASTLTPSSNGATDEKPASGGAHPWTSMSREEAARVCGSRAGNMRAFLTLVLDGEYGGAERYLTETLGFDDEELVRIKANLVVDVKMAGEEAVVRPRGIEGWTMDGGCSDV